MNTHQDRYHIFNVFNNAATFTLNICKKIPLLLPVILLFAFIFTWAATNVAVAQDQGMFSDQKLLTPSADSPQDVFAADLDGDGDQDMLSASSVDNKIAWYENDGAGGFGTQQVITTEADEAESVFAADLDGDGDIDVLSASGFIDFSNSSNSEGKISWYENDGSGGFGDQLVITTEAVDARSVFAADLNGDGDKDVLSASSDDDKIAWHENDGAGGFGDQQVITTEAVDARSVFAADLDGDGDQDVLSASSDDDKIAWYENQGSGSFSAQKVINQPAVDTDGDGEFDEDGNAVAPQSVFAADLDGDGDQDVLSASVVDDKIAWYENDGAGGFGDQQVITTEADGALSVFTADLDGDNDLDVLSASQNDDTIAWYEDNGSGGFGVQLVTNDADRANSVFAADLDGDGDPDVLSTSSKDDKIAWYENDGAVGFEGFGDPQVITTESDVTESVFATDLDGDGDKDVLAALDDDDIIAWYENDGSDEFGGQRVITNDVEGPRSVFAADLDGDGDKDVLSAEIGVSNFDNDKIAWYENDGAGGFGEKQIVSTEVETPRSVFATDLDGDGDVDVLSASPIAWYENNGSGNFGGFGDQKVINAGGGGSVFATDLDGDGDPDVLSAAGREITWYENDGSAGFGDQKVITTEVDDAQSVFAADLDGDSDADVLSASEDDDKIAWYENQGSGSFSAQKVINQPAEDTDNDGFNEDGNAEEAQSVYAADLDGDGDSDVLSASQEDSKIAWYENDGSGGFGGQKVIATDAFGARSVFAADLNGDGDPDVLTGSRVDRIAWYENEGSTATSIAEGSGDIPEKFILRQNYPNPFNPSTTIEYGLPAAVEVSLTVYDMMGREVLTLVNQRQSAGTHSVNFDASRFASGVYLYRLEAGDIVETRKLTLIK